MKNILILLLISTNLLAQGLRDEKYTPPENSIFNQESEKFKNYTTDYKHAIKLTPLTVFRSKIGLLYEYQVNSFFSFQLGGGVQFQENFLILTNLESEAYLYTNDYSILSLYRLYYDGERKNSISPYLNPTIRLNYDGYYLDNQYVEFNYRYQRASRIYEYEYQGMDNFGNNFSIRDELDITLSTSTFAIMFGASVVSAAGSLNFIHEFYYGIGYSSVRYNDLEIDDSNDFYTGNERLSLSENKPVVLTLNFFIGYNLGLGW